MFAFIQPDYKAHKKITKRSFGFHERSKIQKHHFELINEISSETKGLIDALGAW